MSQGITHINVSLDQAEEHQLQAHGFQKINVNLNNGGPGHAIFIWYKKQSGAAPITRVQVTYDDRMCDGLAKAGYTKISKNLVSGQNHHLWYFKGTTKYDTPIVNLEITTKPEDEPEKMKFNWERAGCDLNKTNPDFVYLWLKREQQTYICDVTATDDFGSDPDLFKRGYIRVDDSTNSRVKGDLEYIWYRQTTDPKQALTDLQISTNDDEYNECQQQGYSLVNVNLNVGTGGNTVYMWYKKEEGQSPIQSMLLLLNAAAKPLYEKAGVTVIDGNLNSGNNGPVLYLCFFQ